MTDLSTNALEQLRNSTEILNSLSDSAAQTIRETESFLEESRVGEYCEVSLTLGAYSAEADEPDWEDFLCYYQHSSGKFRIGVLRRFSSREVPNDLTPWAECSRDEKLSSFEKLPALLMKIAEVINGRADRARRTIEAVNTAIKFPPPKKKKGGN